MPSRQSDQDEQGDKRSPNKSQRSRQGEPAARPVNGRSRQAELDARYENEYPNVPKIRRASRPTFADEQPLPIITNKLPVVDEIDEYLDDEQEQEDIVNRIRNQRIQRQRASKQNKRNTYEDDDVYPEDGINGSSRKTSRDVHPSQQNRQPYRARSIEHQKSTHSSPSLQKRRRPYDRDASGSVSPTTPRPTQNNLPVTPRPAQISNKTGARTTAQHKSGTVRPTSPQLKEHLARHDRHERHHRTRTALSLLQEYSRNRTFVLCAIGLALLLVFLPIFINVARNNAASSVSPINGQTGTSSGTSQGVGQQASFPHELIITPPETDHPAPPVLATSAYLLDADTGNTLYAFNPFMHLPMMSTTKMMTATLAIEQGNLDQNVTINNQIASDLNTLSSDSSHMGIKKGETYTLRQLLYGLMLVSGNDAAIAIADTIGGNLPHFVTMMNTKAQSLNLLDTHFTNPHGLLDTGHYSSAHDLAVLGRYAFSISELRTIDGTRTYDIAKTSTHAAHHMFNGNQFLWWYPGVDGGKPGWDGGSNFVQVVSCTRNGHHLIGVVMHTVTWWTDMRDLMNYGFNTFNWVSPAIADKQSAIPYDNLWNYFSDDKTTATITTASGRYYVYTGYSVSTPILAYFDHNGGLNKFGFPTSLLLANSGTSVSQKFQRTTIQCDLNSKQCKTV